jgi:hypothetical protein
VLEKGCEGKSEGEVRHKSNSDDCAPDVRSNWLRKRTAIYARLRGFIKVEDGAAGAVCSVWVGKRP